MKKIILLLIFLVLFSGCGILLHKSFSIDSIDSKKWEMLVISLTTEKKNYSLSEENIPIYYLLFTGPDSTAYPIDSPKREIYRGLSDINIHIGTEKSELDSFPLRPNKIKNKTIDEIEYIVNDYRT